MIGQRVDAALKVATTPIIIMIVAIVFTKIPTLLGHDFWIFHAPKLARYGFWSTPHEARPDFDMLLGAHYLLIVGAGAGRWMHRWLERLGTSGERLSPLFDSPSHLPRTCCGPSGDRSFQPWRR